MEELRVNLNNIDTKVTASICDISQKIADETAEIIAGMGEGDLEKLYKYLMGCLEEEVAFGVEGYRTWKSNK